MTEETLAVERPTPVPVTARVTQGLRHRRNWLQLAKFCAVGASGYVVNLCVFALCVGPLDLHHLAAATAAFLVAVTNNFWWNRRWTFAARRGSASFQATRFFAVSVAAFVLAAAVLELLVSAFGVPEVPAQAVAIIVATPLNFIGNKMWSFGAGR